MFESATFAVSWCDACARDVVVAWDLSDDESDLVPTCSRCDGRLDDEGRVMRPLEASELPRYGYEVEGAGTSAEGCGSGGGCSACGAAR